MEMHSLIFQLISFFGFFVRLRGEREREICREREGVSNLTIWICEKGEIWEFITAMKPRNSDGFKFWKEVLVGSSYSWPLLVLYFGVWIWNLNCEARESNSSIGLGSPSYGFQFGFQLSSFKWAYHAHGLFGFRLLYLFTSNHSIIDIYNLRTNVS